MTSTVLHAASGGDQSYEQLRAMVAGTVTRRLMERRPIFTTDVTDLYSIYLAHLPPSIQQIHRCRTCQRFVDTYGGLVVIEGMGHIRPLLWDLELTPPLYRQAVSAVLDALHLNAQVTGVFYTDQQQWGTPETGTWTHLAAELPRLSVYESLIATPAQAMAEKREDARLLRAALERYRLRTVVQACALLEDNQLYRSERILGVATWLRGVLTIFNTLRGRSRDNFTWQAVAAAPAGFCHIGSTMIGTLLDDLEQNLPFAVVKERFDQKMNPTRYQRPQAAPAAGNIKHAEQLIEKLQAAGALKRRYARIEDVQAHAIWTPRRSAGAQPAVSGVFAGVQPKQQGRRIADRQIAGVPPVTLTWVKFRDTVLPIATAIAYLVPLAKRDYGALVTAADESAPLIFQWNNPVSWYVYQHGSGPSTWGLKAQQHHTVTAIVPQPSMWDDDQARHQGAGVFFLLDGARDQEYLRAGGAIFPEILRAEFHAIKPTIEAYSRGAVIDGHDRATAAGLVIQRGNGRWSDRFRVTTNDGLTRDYVLDRWD